MNLPNYQQSNQQLDAFWVRIWTIASQWHKEHLQIGLPYLKVKILSILLGWQSQDAYVLVQVCLIL